MRIIDRLDKYMAVNGINDNQITVNCGLSIGLIGKARRGDSDLGKKAIEKILTFYQDINKTWLLTGEGPMLKSSRNPFSQMTEQEIEAISAETIAEELLKLLKSGEVFLAATHHKIVEEKNEEIAKLHMRLEKIQRENWELQQKIDELTK